MKKGYQVALLLAFGGLFAAFAFNPPKQSADWASWVQAWGSIAAICAAIWVAHDQHEKSETRHARAEKDEVRNFLSGVREELQVNWAVYMQQVGVHVNEFRKGEAIELTWPVPDNPFKVYAATVHVIGRLPDANLRKSIIVTYVVAGGLLHTWRMHNELRSRRDLEKKTILVIGGERESLAWVELNAALTEYSDQLFEHQAKAAWMIELTIEEIDAYLGSNG